MKTDHAIKLAEEALKIIQDLNEGGYIIEFMLGDSMKLTSQNGIVGVWLLGERVA